MTARGGRKREATVSRMSKAKLLPIPYNFFEKNREETRWTDEIGEEREVKLQSGNLGKNERRDMGKK